MKGSGMMQSLTMKNAYLYFDQMVRDNDRAKKIQRRQPATTKGRATMTTSNEYYNLQRNTYELLCIQRYNESMHNLKNNLQYSANKYTNNEVVCMMIETANDSTAFIRHSVCESYANENTYNLLQVLEQNNLFNKYTKLLRLFLKTYESYYYHMNTAMVYVAMYVLITNKVLKNCMCDDCMEVNDTSNEQPATTATVAADYNESEI
jgi:uncharacterized FlaG/YvyC family protein